MKHLENGEFKMNVDNIKFGLDTFGDVAYDKETGKRVSYEESIRGVIEEAKLADELGIDIITFGEHHRAEYSISSPEIIMAALATVTKNITLGTGVTVLSSDDPIRLYQRFATLDAISEGRTQVMLGRGSFTESYRLFGYDLQDYDELFEEKTALFAKLIEGGPVTWEGKFTPTLNEQDVYPKMTEREMDVNIGVGGTPESVVRAAHYGFPLMLAIIGGSPTRFKPYIELYKRAAEEFGKPVHPVGMHSPGIIAETDEEARALGMKYLVPNMNLTGLDRGWQPMTKEQFDFQVDRGAYYIGKPETVAQKIAKVIKDTGIERFDLVYGMGGFTPEERLKNIELYGKVVIPRVKEILREGDQVE